jgi:hypothetical protein
MARRRPTSVSAPGSASHDLLPDGWKVGPALRHAYTGRWAVTARSPRYAGRGIPPAVVERHGEDEIAALTDLSIKLDELRAGERRMAIEERARAAFLHGAEEHSRATLGRPLTPDELERVLRRYSGP